MKKLHSKFRIPLFLRKEDGDLLKIENSLVKTMSELRDKELSHINLSQEFSIRLKNQLKTVQLEPENGWKRIWENTLSNRGLQFSFSGVLVFAIVFVTYNRIQSSGVENQSERAGTLFGQSETGNFQDIPSSGKFQSGLNEELIKQISSTSESRKTVLSLRKYFFERGEIRIVEELDRILEQTNNP
ncbi:LIMLP_12425 family protein [Leptospira noguchii]|uniref:Uncharacterized protein n=1 Tax=Leptospira noguchii TaxID=28182 RepID=A0A9Q8VUF2_9LEPT|nr:hypothetical protein [Leptospira noguchii]EKR74815.1 hypothetical protein LEP1GSC041_3120 [Leptospira noguchii str. 2006001870]EMS83498.1 hypothetical protein LEP1GSC074_4304 [Leptospira noguchii str. Hook]TQE80398.1 hypothetical protein FF021_05030 [Leptospira noguchii]UOG29557.1 hypothetical protein MAL06_12885 [Leptospira noguchii]UOG35112.1 hypothetical protein MAL02_05200 [Leptospira noguchii]